MFKSAWGGREVLAMTDCLWGVLDGLNGAKLCVSLTFGGRRVVGEGFGIPLILRYVLETCATAREGVAALCRIPSHMAYNVTLVDGNGDHYTVHVGPDRSAAVGRDLVTTNHQREVEWQQHARATATLERERFLKFRLAESDSGEDLARAFLRSPLYSIDYQRGFGTLYTAVYRPFETSVELLWPNASWRQSLAHFTEERRTVRFPRGAL
ncbi:MAG: C45 family autoproteolytic acyltransferase/hydrolase, partial [Candidatus Competibacterales bacterium]